MMNHLQAMRVFLKVAENGSFGRAAASLDLSNAVVTRYVALLETHLNTRLVNRTTRSVSLTEAGLAYAEGCRQTLEQLDAMESSISQSATHPAGTLKLVAVASFSLFGLTPLLQRYRALHPTVKLSVTLLHRPVDLIEEGFDVGIVVPGQVSSGTLIKRSLFRVRAIAVASHGYIGANGMPKTPASLSAHTFLAPSATMRSCCARPPSPIWALRFCPRTTSPQIYWMERSCGYWPVIRSKGPTRKCRSSTPAGGTFQQKPDRSSISRWTTSGQKPCRHIPQYSKILNCAICV
jgi:DNA-binding transcriptional LysR family regulator